MNQDLIQPSLLVAGGLVIGGGAGYLIARRQLRLKFEALLDQEVANLKDHYDRKNKDGVFSTPEGAAAVLIGELAAEDTAKIVRGVRRTQQILERQGYSSAAVGSDGITALEEAPDGSVTIVNIENAQVVVEEHSVFEDSPDPTHFDENGAPWDLGLPPRSSDEPYIIHLQEFMESDWDQITITYYEGDDTLCDEREQIIPDVEALVGQHHMGMFGRGSNDDNIIYIRNEAIRTDFEVVRSEAGYAEAVMGMTPDELEPAARNPRRRTDVRDG